jgi:hypothetical protein
VQAGDNPVRVRDSIIPCAECGIIFATAPCPACKRAWLCGACGNHELDACIRLEQYADDVAEQVAYIVVASANPKARYEKAVGAIEALQKHIGLLSKHELTHAFLSSTEYASKERHDFLRTQSPLAVFLAIDRALGAYVCKPGAAIALQIDPNTDTAALPVSSMYAKLIDRLLETNTPLSAIMVPNGPGFPAQRVVAMRKASKATRDALADAIVCCASHIRGLRTRVALADDIRVGQSDHLGTPERIDCTRRDDESGVSRIVASGVRETIGGLESGEKRMNYFAMRLFTQECSPHYQRIVAYHALSGTLVVEPLEYVSFSDRALLADVRGVIGKDAPVDIADGRLAKFRNYARADLLSQHPEFAQKVFLESCLHMLVACGVCRYYPNVLTADALTYRRSDGTDLCYDPFSYVSAITSAAAGAPRARTSVIRIKTSQDEPIPVFLLPEYHPVNAQRMADPRPYVENGWVAQEEFLTTADGVVRGLTVADIAKAIYWSATGIGSQFLYDKASFGRIQVALQSMQSMFPANWDTMSFPAAVAAMLQGAMTHHPDWFYP